MDQSTSEWYLDIKKEQIEKYGAVVPPWVFSPDSHPLSIEWRMGSGETQVMVFSIWWDQQQFSEEDALRYFKKFPPPPRWMMWMADVLWEIEIWDPDEFEGSPSYHKLLDLGFEGVKNVISDF